jgi:hypothetical protein
MVGVTTMKCNTEGCNKYIQEDDWFCGDHHWEGVANMFPEDSCSECGTYTHDGSWCEDCLDEIDLDEYEERKRQWLAEAQEE